MDDTFDAGEFIRQIGKRVVVEFENARSATTPTAVGDAMEQPVRDQLENILPSGIAVGSGFVIDSHGATSRQTDIVLYERNICPVFSINNTPNTTYYPCEGVIAVGQVKSVLNKTQLREEFERIASVKRLKRFPKHHPVPYKGDLLPLERNYGSTQTPSVISMEAINQPDGIRQIDGFILADKVQMPIRTLMKTIVELTRQTGVDVSPNSFILLTEGQMQWGKISTHTDETTGLHKGSDGPIICVPSWSAEDGDLLCYSNNNNPFGVLIRQIYQMYAKGLTSHIEAFDRYFQKGASSRNEEQIFLPRNGMTIDEYLDKGIYG